jgi:hypothetical protein
MRARHRHVLAALIAAIAVALTSVSGPVSGDTQVQAESCPRGTSWDNLLHRCV